MFVKSYILYVWLVLDISLAFTWHPFGKFGVSALTPYRMDVWKVFLFSVFLVRIFPHFDWTILENLRIQSEYGKKRTRKTLNTGTFYAVNDLIIYHCDTHIIAIPLTRLEIFASDRNTFLPPECQSRTKRTN